MKKALLTFIPLLIYLTLSAQPNCMQIGVGLEGPAYWSRGENPFIDQMKWRGAWITFNAQGQSPWDTQLDHLIPLDPNGYPNAGIPYNTSSGSQKLRMVLSAGHRIPASRQYAFLYDGYGDFSFYGFSVDTIQPGRIVATLNGTGNVWMHIDSSAPAPNHARNFRLIPLGQESTYEQEMFRPPFLEKLAPFHSIRFMDWFHTNNSPLISWDMRSTPNSYSQADSAGVCYEYAIELCNRTEKHPWVNVPHLADSAFIAEMARMWHNQLSPDLDIYVEYSNETWNWQFLQAQWIIQNTTWPPAHWPLNTEYNPNQNFSWNSGLKSRRVFRIWRREWGPDSLRVKRVLGTQAAWPQATAYGNIEGANYQYDILSPTWYFGLSTGQSASLDSSTTAQQVIDTCRNNFFAHLKDNLKLHYQIVDSFGGEVAHYEGGQHISAYGNNSHPALQAFYDAQVHPDMYNLYDEVLDSLRGWGSTLSMAFVLGGGNSQYGSWGHISSVDSTPSLSNSPKYIALLDNILSQPDAGLPSDTTICNGDQLVLAANPGFDSYNWSTGDFISSITTTNAGNYTVTITDEFGCSSSDSTLVIVDPCLFTDSQGRVTIAVYPNPSQGRINIEFTDLHCQQFQATCFDLHGKKLFAQTFHCYKGILDLPLATGTYILQIDGCNLKHTIRISKTH